MVLRGRHRDRVIFVVLMALYGKGLALPSAATNCRSGEACVLHTQLLPLCALRASTSPTGTQLRSHATARSRGQQRQCRQLRFVRPVWFHGMLPRHSKIDGAFPTETVLHVAYPFEEMRTPQPPMSGTLAPDGNLELDAGCHFRVWLGANCLIWVCRTVGYSEARRKVYESITGMIEIC